MEVRLSSGARPHVAGLTNSRGDRVGRFRPGRFPARVAVLFALAGWLASCASATVPAPAFSPQTDASAYRAAREQLIAAERAMRLGAQLVLTEAEQAAALRLARLKSEELTRGRDTFAPAQSFFEERTKRLYEQSAVFGVLRRMPKGAVLHAHFTAMGDYRWVADRALASPHAQVFIGDDPQIPRGALRLSTDPVTGDWRQLSALRAAAPDQKAFDEEVFRSITLGEEDRTVPDIWEEFTTIFGRTRGLFADPTFTAEFFDQLVATLVRDNVQYLELRSNPVDESWIEKARRHDPAFDVRFIPASGRSVRRDQAARFLDNVVEQRLARPDRVKGFDLVQEEDRGNTNLFYLDEILNAQVEARRRGTELPAFLHSGESNWAENENLYDAVLLGTRRIGHALALIRHPLLLREVKARDIAIEVCPISNQLLGFVADLRTHPAAHYINDNIPIVLSTDDPGIFQSTLTHDFYAAYMAWGLDLKALKQLAMNSLRYSTMTPQEKERLLTVWQERWASFIAWINATYPA
jgi:adenosine deaminase CECR1